MESLLYGNSSIFDKVNNTSYNSYNGNIEEKTKKTIY